MAESVIRALRKRKLVKITLITVGKVKEKYLRDAIAEYSKRLGRYCKLDIVEVADEKTPEHASDGLERQIKAKEGERIAKHIRDDAFVIALAIEGKQLTSEQLAAKINDLFDLRPAAIVREFGLRNPIFEATASYGHFGNRPYTQKVTLFEKGKEVSKEIEFFAWEKLDAVDKLKKAFRC